MSDQKVQRGLQVGDKVVVLSTGEQVTVMGWHRSEQGFRQPDRLDVVVRRDDGTRGLIRRADLELV